MNDHKGEKKTETGVSSYFKQKVPPVRGRDLCVVLLGTIGVHLLAIFLVDTLPFTKGVTWLSPIKTGGAALMFCGLWAASLGFRELPPGDSTEGIGVKPCPSCGQAVAETSEKCPHCFGGWSQWFRWLAVQAVAFCIGLAFIGLAGWVVQALRG